MQVDDGMVVVVGGNLIQHIGVIDVRSIARAGRIQPVGGGIVITLYRPGHRAACGEHALFGNGQGRFCFLGQHRAAQQHERRQYER